MLPRPNGQMDYPIDGPNRASVVGTLGSREKTFLCTVKEAYVLERSNFKRFRALYFFWAREIDRGENIVFQKNYHYLRTFLLLGHSFTNFQGEGDYNPHLGMPRCSIPVWLLSQ